MIPAARASPNSPVGGVEPASVCSNVCYDVGVPGLVSVIIPTYDRASLIGDAIASVRAQGDDRYEIVVADDGSTDGTADVVRAAGANVVYVPLSHHGVSAARNAGIAAASGELIAFLDSDDVWPLGSLTVRRAYLADHPEADAVYGLTALRQRGAATRRFGPYDERTPIRFPLLGSLLCRRSAFEKVGRFDESLEHAEDVEWFARATELGVTLSLIEDVILEYRIHDGNMTLDVERNQAFLLRALKRTLDRRRA